MREGIKKKRQLQIIMSNVVQSRTNASQLNKMHRDRERGREWFEEALELGEI